MNMTKELLIEYIRRYDDFFADADLENYSYHELMLIKISIDAEKQKEMDGEYYPIQLIEKVH